jgi:hypothetical protein
LNEGFRHVEEYAMKPTTALCVALAISAFAAPAHAVFKCTTAKGVVYQDRPCRDGTESDVRITVPTGQVAPSGTAAAEDAASANSSRSENRTQSVKPVRYSGDGSTSAAKRAEQQRAEAGATDASARSKDAPVTLDRTTTMTADQARKTDPSAKYYSNESFSAGNQTPVQMNCESPSGERRTFYLSDGKLTSI